MKKFLRTYPTVSIHLEYQRANQVYEDVLGNVVDLGLVAYPSKDPRLEVVPFREETMTLICHPGHPFAKLKSLQLSQLQGRSSSDLNTTFPTRRAVDRILRSRTSR